MRRRKVWKLRDQANKENFEQMFAQKVQGVTTTTTEELWSCLKKGLMKSVAGPRNVNGRLNVLLRI